MELGGALDLRDGDAGGPGLGDEVARHAGPGAGEDDEAVDSDSFLLPALLVHVVNDAGVSGPEFGL